MHRCQLLGATVEQIHRQHRAEQQYVEQLGKCRHRQSQKGRVGNVLPKQRSRNREPYDVVPTHHNQRAEPFELRFYDYRIDRYGNYRNQNQRIAIVAASVRKYKSVVEEQDACTDKGEYDTCDACRCEGCVRDNPRKEECEHRAEGRYCRGINGIGVGGSPQQHVHPSVDYQQRYDEDIAEVAPGDAVGALGEDGKGDKEHRRGEDLEHKYLPKVEEVFGQRDKKRKVGAKEQVGADQIPIILDFSHCRGVYGKVRSKERAHPDLISTPLAPWDRVYKMVGTQSRADHLSNCPIRGVVYCNGNTPEGTG